MTYSFNNQPLIILSILFLVSHSGLISTQELDEDFLNSLPVDIKNEILNSNDEQTSTSNDKSYDSFKTSLPSENQDINQDINRELKVFGRDYFNSFASTFMPINDPSASSDYILDVDDKIFIQYFGDNTNSFETKINRSGEIILSDIGALKLAGLRISDANNLVNMSVNQSLVNTKAYVTLTEVRDINILLSGYVENPGFYVLSGYSNVFHALTSAGGILKNGSMRNIQIKRNGEIIKEIDLYDSFIDGDTSSIISLRSGDAVLVSPTNNYVPVMGAVNREAIYEFKNGETVADIVSFAGGSSSDINNNENFVLVRESDGFSETIGKLDDNSKEMKVMENDKLFLKFKNYVAEDEFLSSEESFIDIPITVSGAVKFPGSYIIKQNQTLLELIEDFGGYRNDAYVFGAALYNEEAKKIEKEYNLRLYNDAIKSLANISSLSRVDSPSSITSLLEEFKNINSLGRIVTEFDEKKIKGDPTLNYKLSPGDEIFVPYLKNIVYVFGEVLNPGTLVFKQDLKIMDYIEKSGGLNDFADKSSIIIVQPNGESNKIQLRNFSGFKSDIYPGSVIYVPRNLKQIDGIELGSIIAPIVSSLAISLASINSISNN